MFGKLGLIGDLFAGLFKRGKFWLIPIALVLIILAVIIIFGQATGLGPLIYPFI